MLADEATVNPPTTTARGMCTIDMQSGRVLYEHNADDRMPMASTTKIATAITVLENCYDLDTPIEINPKARGIEGTSIYIQKGEKLTVRELLYGMMLRSGNDAAMAMALHVAKDNDAFCDLMNETARKAGATNTQFKNPHGLDADGHYTTAGDLAKISAYAMKNPIFAEIVATKDTTISGPDYKRPIRNKNRLLHSVPDCVGIKTGFTKKAGRCYVGAFEQNGMTVISVVLNCGPMFEEAANLMEHGLEEYTMTRVLCAHEPITVDGEMVGIAVEDFLYPLQSGETPDITTQDNEVIVKLGKETIYKSAFNAL